VRARHAALVLVTLVMVAVLASSAAAQQPVTAEIVAMTKPVEILRRGQTAWAAAAVGARLGDGDQIRALAAGTAELALPDRSTIFVAENTRFAVTRLEHDPQTGARTSAFHLVVGKVRAEVTRASVQLVRTRQSNFSISTPLGVAGVRGTRMVVAYTPPTGQPPAPPAPPRAGDAPSGPVLAAAAPVVAQAAQPAQQAPLTSQAGEQVLIVCLPSPGQDPFAAQCLYYDAATKSTVLLVGNQFIFHDPTQPLGVPASTGNLPAGLAALLALINPFTANHPLLFDPGVNIPTWSQTQAALLGMPFGGQAGTIPSSFMLGGSPTGQGPLPTSTGRDNAVTGPGNQQCASPPCGPP